MKIWVIGRSYPEPDNNMTGSFEIEQAKMLHKNGEDVSYLCCSLHPKKKIKEWGFQSWQEEGMAVYSYSARFFPRIYPFYFLKKRGDVWSRFLQWVFEKEGMPEVIHVHYPAMLMLADVLLPFQKRGVKIVVTEHWSKVLLKSLDKTELLQYRKYFQYIDACICVGSPLEHAVQEIVGDTKTMMFLVPNVICPEFQPVYRKHDGFEFIAVGRLVKVKQFDQVIQAFSEVFRGKDARLTIIGGGEEQKQLLKLIDELSMEEQIILTGRLPRTQVAKRIATADCLVCYSRFETFGVPIIEAWACGVPTMATTTTAVIDNFDERLGVEVHYDNIDELKEKMMYMYENIDRYNKKFISEFTQERFSEKAVYGKLKDVYQKVRQNM